MTFEMDKRKILRGMHINFSGMMDASTVPEKERKGNGVSQ